MCTLVLYVPVTIVAIALLTTISKSTICTFIAEAIKSKPTVKIIVLPLHQFLHGLHVPALRRHVQTRVPVRRGADEHAGVHGDVEAHDVTVAALSRRQQHHLVVVGLQLDARVGRHQRAAWNTGRDSACVSLVALVYSPHSLRRFDVVVK